MTHRPIVLNEGAAILPLRAELDTERAPREQAGIQLVRVSKSFGSRSVLTDVDLSVEPQEFLALVGRSGCGKSTLLRLIAGLIAPTSGQVLIGGTPLAGVNPRARMMFQDARLLPWLRVADNVALGAGTHQAASVANALELVQLADRAHDWPTTLSGGQRQRVALARALIGRPPLLLLDEPLGALDALTRIEMQQLIFSLWQQHRCTAVLVTHDIEEALMLADRVVILENGAVREEFVVAMPRPRDRMDSRFQQLAARLLERVLRPTSTAVVAPALRAAVLPESSDA